VILAAAGSAKTMWYLTRGSGVVALVLLTASFCLGIAGTLGWRLRRLPRFAVAALHRNLTLLAVVFVGIHVATTVLDGFAPVGWKDAVVPFLSPYRPFWLGLGAVAFDLLLALVITSLLRVRLGYRRWRFVHWLAYACWPIAFLHSLGTGSDPRAGWLVALAAASAGAVVLAVLLRLARSGGDPLLRLGLAAVTALAGVLGLVWYRTGPGASGWAARAGTPAALLHSAATGLAASRTASSSASLPSTFHARLSGRLTESTAGGNGLVDVHLDGQVAGSLHGRLRIVLEGVPLDDGGVSMTASGVAFGARGTAVYEGGIVALDGDRVSARVSDRAGQTLALSMVLQVDSQTSRLTGTVDGRLE
jgi:DMSO/TMAO reductase YedYZ heme-binding membrane subunit